MKLNKLERFTAYCILLAEIEGGGWIVSYGFCWMYSKVFDDSDIYDHFESILPELYAKRTNRISNYLFRSWKERKQALIESIKETHP
jgi:hypothetical protein